MGRKGSDIPRLARRNGVFNVLFTEPARTGPNGKTIRSRTRRIGLRTRDPDKAKDLYAAFLVEGDALVRRDRTPELTIFDALDQYYREHVLARCADSVRQENAIRHLKEAFGEMPIREIDIPRCRQYAELRRTGAIGGGARKKGDLKKGSDSTIRRELVVLRAAANHAIRWKRLVGPMPTFELPSERGTKEEVKWISREGIETLIEAAISESMPLHHFIKLTYWWGARRGWVERLHKSQVNLKTGRVNPYAVGEKVTVKRRLILPIFDAVKPNIEALVHSAPDNGYLFGSASVDFYRPFRRLCELVGYEDRSHPHVLRHSRATHMLMAGESIYKVARLLGDSVQTVERVYGHHSVEYLMEQEQR